MGDSCAKVAGHSHELINIRLSTFFFFFLTSYLNSNTLLY